MLGSAPWDGEETWLLVPREHPGAVPAAVTCGPLVPSSLSLSQHHLAISTPIERVLPAPTVLRFSLPWPPHTDTHCWAFTLELAITITWLPSGIQFKHPTHWSPLPTVPLSRPDLSYLEFQNCRCNGQLGCLTGISNITCPSHVHAPPSPSPSTPALPEFWPSWIGIIFGCSLSQESISNFW